MNIYIHSIYTTYLSCTTGGTQASERIRKQRKYYIGKNSVVHRSTESELWEETFCDETDYTASKIQEKTVFKI